MSGAFGIGSTSPATLAAGTSSGSALLDLLSAEDIVPGSDAGYELCKTIYTAHPLGPVLADDPITMAQSQEREIAIACAGEQILVDRFTKSWKQFSGVGGSFVIHNLCKTARIYGLATLGVGTRGVDSGRPLRLDRVHSQDIFVSVFDPLNTAGSLVLDQDPNSSDFMKPQRVAVAGKPWHPSRTLVMMNEQPVYISFVNSAFGFVGRSVYQRVLYPLKTYVQSMITDQMVTQKVGLLIAKMKTPGSILDNEMLGQTSAKLGNIKAGQTGNVASIGIDEAIETLNMMNVDGAGKFARDNMLKNIATGACMPAALVNKETLAEGFGEGSEDAKQIARFVDFIRQWMAPAYAFVDAIVMRQAWTPDLFESMQKDFPEYRKMSFETAFYLWSSSFTAEWPNLLTEPDSEKAKVDDVIFKSVVALLEVMAPQMDPENKARLFMWAADNINERKKLFAGKLEIDEEALATYQPPAAVEGPREPLAFESET